MFQPEDMQLHALHWNSPHSGLNQERRQTQVVKNSSTVVSILKNSVPAGASANKKAVIDRLIALYAQGALG